ncbi:XylR family transcriptional regulator [Calycomorphotria hydatis]|uniref:Xylose operon regulatory protein n=1 Tax=Calycomorphotria hydatis TaxID=2528027 RepID=A0A517T949_9PLAN|nr:DNA-binding transcriptional regulator [Calycomorphotria hydatis]QDT64887.1 Xylose operon regulatory protein [Calycomorphotria hydatis]
MDRRPKVALLIESSRAYGRGLLRGISNYLKERGHWSIYLEERNLADTLPEELLAWKPDGIIARVEHPVLADFIRESGIPTVDMFAKYDMPAVPSFDDDDSSICSVAAEHLLARGFRQFGYCGFPGVHFSQNRLRHFTAFFREQDIEVSCYSSESHEQALTATAELHALEDTSSIIQWLNDLPKPIGILACNDTRAQQLLRICADLEIAVPEEVAVIGIDNDDVICELCNPPLTSVEPDTKRIGYYAAETLDKMMRGESVSDGLTVVPPLGVVPRHSTDITVGGDAITSEALDYLHKYAFTGESIELICDRLGISRSTMERRIRSLLGRSPKAEVDRLRILQSKELLLRTDFSVDVIAHKVGYEHPSSFHRAFRGAEGQTPQQFRQNRKCT